MKPLSSIHAGTTVFLDIVVFSEFRNTSAKNLKRVDQPPNVGLQKTAVSCKPPPKLVGCSPPKTAL